LTETVMLRHHLLSVLREARRQDYVPAEPEWYYEHCLVRPLWESAEGLSYVVELPMASSTVAAYQLDTYPFLRNGDWYRLVIHERVGYDEEDGTMTVLKQCRGTTPVMCEKNLPM